MQRLHWKIPACLQGNQTENERGGRQGRETQLRQSCKKKKKKKKRGRINESCLTAM